MIGSSTVTAMQSGVFWGYVSMVEGMVARIKAEFGAEMKVIATGGLAGLFAGATEVIEHVDRDLTVAGLVELFYADRPRVRTEGRADVGRSGLFVPLGGAGEIGLNLNLYGSTSWLMVDLGISFADETLPGVEIVLPDPELHRRAQRGLCGLVLTHAHEDHFGAIPYLWERLRCPIYCTRFTAAVLRRKLEEAGSRAPC